MCVYVHIRVYMDKSYCLLCSVAIATLMCSSSAVATWWIKCDGLSALIWITSARDYSLDYQFSDINVKCHWIGISTMI